MFIMIIYNIFIVIFVFIAIYIFNKFMSGI